MSKDCFLAHGLGIRLFKRCHLCELGTVFRCVGLYSIVIFVLFASVVTARVLFPQIPFLKPALIVMGCLLLLLGVFVNSNISKVTCRAYDLKQRNKTLEGAIEKKTKDLKDMKGLFHSTVDKMENELIVLGKLQKELLPRSSPKFKGLKFSIHYQPSTQASGDYYDFIDITPGMIGIVVADVSGHGAAAAVSMAITRVLMQGFAIAYQSPSKTLERINFMMHRLVPTDQFITMFYAIYDAETQQLKYSSAGHPMPHLLSGTSHEVAPLKDVGSFPLKVFEDVKYPERTIKLEQGDKLIIFTDGLTEAMNHKNELFGDKRVAEQIMKFARGSSRTVDDLRYHIIESVTDFVKGKPFEDDFTMLIMELDNTD